MGLLGCGDEPVLVCNDCSDRYANRIIHVAYVKRGTVLPTTTPGAFMTALLAAEIAGNAYIVRNISGESNGGTYSDREGRGKQDTQNGPISFTVTYSDSTPVTLTSFYNTIKNSGERFYGVYFTTELAHIANERLRIKPIPVISRDIKTYIQMNVEVMWTSNDLPVIVKGIDDSLLESCPELFTFSAANWALQGGSDGVLLSGEVTLATTETLDILYPISNLYSVQLTDTSDALPAGISIEATSTGIRVYGTVSIVGTNTVEILASTITGVASVATLTIIVV